MNTYSIKISQESEATSSNSYKVSGDGSIITIQRVIYNNLKSLVHNSKVTKAPEGKGSAYDEFLSDMEMLHDIMYNGSTEDIPEGLEYLNQYLGEIGIDQNYPMRKDVIHLNRFLNADYLDVDPLPIPTT